jgi:GAF domain-containing protein
MYERPALHSSDLGQFYTDLNLTLTHVLEGERDPVSNLANASALLFDQLPDLNWAGFYLLRPRPHGGEHLLVGPFQGKPACARIPLGKGVCGTAAQRRETIVVPDVHAFPGHIACDGASQSEIVVPLLTPNARLLGVLDLDSPKLARFTEVDSRGLEAFVAQLLALTDF